MKGISAVIATYNRKKELKTFFESIIANNIDCFEAIIVDQNTDNLIDDIIREYSKRLEIKHLKIAGPNQCRARNMGAAKAKYSILCFPDDDCWFEPDSLKKILDHFDSAIKTDLLIINWKQHPSKPARSSYITKDELFSFRSVGYGTIVLFFRTAVFFDLGGFFEKIGIGKYIGGGEDSELTFRAASNNLQLYYNKDIGINHLYNPVRNRDLNVIRTRQRAMGYLYARYNIPYWVILRGLTAPFIKMLFTLGTDKSKEFYQTGKGRLEGLFHGLRERNKDWKTAKA